MNHHSFFFALIAILLSQASIAALPNNQQSSVKIRNSVLDEPSSENDSDLKNSDDETLPERKGAKQVSKKTELTQTKRKNTSEIAAESLRLPIDHALKIIKKNPKIIEELENIAFDITENMDIRWKAFGLVVKYQKENSWPIVNRGLLTTDWYIKQIAILSVGEFHKDRIAQVIPKHLSDKAMVVRSAAVSVLETQAGRQEIRDILWKEIHQERNFRNGKGLWIREQILGILAKDPVRTEISQFAKILYDENPKLGSQAVKSMEYLAGKKLGFTKDSLDTKIKLWTQWTKGPDFKDFEKSSF